ncbi:MAG TPA: hemerythrin domain-containing protein [Polyangia bacterium]
MNPTKNTTPTTPTPDTAPAPAIPAPSTLELAVQAPARLDSFTPIHKGMRRSLFETALLLARTDFESTAETAAAEEATTTCLGYLREHAEHEDRHVIPRLAELDAALAAALEIEHPQLERAALAVDTLWPRIAAAPSGSARAALGRELVRRFQTFVAQQLQHMDREEREVMAVMWAGLTDAELGAISGRIVADIPPARMSEMMALILPALSGPERDAMTRRVA